MIRRLQRFIETHPCLVTITGAGCSAPSGIPTYRDHNGDWQRNSPITHQDFVGKPASRRRYWARSLAGWPAVYRAEPNGAHRALAELERLGIVKLLVTQNVDRLHQKAGHRRVVDLHGRLDRVTCLDCAAVSTRQDLQKRILLLNPGVETHAHELAPDGDAAVAEDVIASLTVPTCLRCDGTLMPDVVFFGGGVPRSKVQPIYRALEDADGLLVVGSSLMVFSAFRFCRKAAELGKPMVLVNAGKTRADDLAHLKIEADCATVLPALISSLSVDAPSLSANQRYSRR